MNSITLQGDAATSVALTGTQALDLSFGDNFGKADSSIEINGKDATGHLRINLAAVNTEASDIVVSTGTGSDVIIAKASGMQAFSGGAGSDVFDVSAALGSSPIVTIQDLQNGDIIRLANVSASGELGDQINVSGAGDLAEALSIASNEAASEAGHLVWFQYGDDEHSTATYIYSANSQVGTSDSADNVVRIVGSVDLEGSSYAGDPDTDAGNLTIGA